MGGGAFAQAFADGQPTLRTPRMSPVEYGHLKAIYIHRLSKYFAGRSVIALQEAPEKLDYGDIDIIVSTDKRVDWVELAHEIGAKAVICLNGVEAQRATLGVVRDGSKNTVRPVVYTHVKTNELSNKGLSDGLTEEAYAQVDIEVVPPVLFEWHSFYASYGDLAGLLGRFVHKLGFTISNKGLSLRLQELEEAKPDHRNQISELQGMLFLSKDPDRVMEFLGLSAARYHEGFTTVDALFTWLGECRLFSSEIATIKRSNAKERQKDKRAIYSQFLYEWLPTHFDTGNLQPEDGQSHPDGNSIDVDNTLDISLKRQQLRDEAVEFFWKQDEFSKKHDALCRSILNQTAATLIKPMIAQHSGAKDKKITEILRAFRRWIGFTLMGQPCILEMAHSDEQSALHGWMGDDGQSLRDSEATDAWIREHWEELKSLERQRAKEAKS